VPANSACHSALSAYLCFSCLLGHSGHGGACAVTCDAGWTPRPLYSIGRLGRVPIGLCALHMGVFSQTPMHYVCSSLVYNQSLVVNPWQKLQSIPAMLTQSHRRPAVRGILGILRWIQCNWYMSDRVAL